MIAAPPESVADRDRPAHPQRGWLSRQRMANDAARQQFPVAAVDAHDVGGVLSRGDLRRSCAVGAEQRRRGDQMSTRWGIAGRGGADDRGVEHGPWCVAPAVNPQHRARRRQCPSLDHQSVTTP